MILRGCFKELKDNELIKSEWADNLPYSITILKNGYLYQEHKETWLKFEKEASDEEFIDSVNRIEKIEVSKYQAKTTPEYDVFISHANKDKENLIEELYQSLNRLGINIFYDKESLEWGDNWKERIINGTQKAEFAIIVISKNFFDRE